MEDDDNFDIIVDSVPPGVLTPPVIQPLPPPPVYAPAAPEPVAYKPVPPPTAPAEPATGPKRSWRGTVLAVGFVLLAVNGGVLAHHYGLISFPDLTSGGKEPSVPAVRPQAKDPGSPPAAANSGAGTANNPAPNKPVSVNPAPAESAPTPAQQAPAKPRLFQSTRDVFAAVRGHLLKTADADRKYQRYFTLAHLHNDKDLSDRQLDQYRAAVTALIHYLQPSPGAARVQPIDPARVVLCLDLRSAGWEKAATWRAILKRYPYGLLASGSANAEVADLANEVRELAGADLPVVMLDWFLTAASQSPLRDQLGPNAAGAMPPAVAVLAQRYRQDIRLEKAARELGLRDSDRLRNAIQASDRLRNLGLGALLNGGALSRERWCSQAGTASPYQEAALELQLGTPYRVRP